LPLGGTNLAVLAGCHVRQDGARFPAALLPRLQGADLIVTLGDMGDRSALDELEEIAPVLGVRGQDDADDMRTRRAILVLDGEGYRIGCVHDAKAAGLATSVSPFVQAKRAPAICGRLFGGPVNVLLHAGTNKPDEARFGAGGSALNPGSPVRPAAGSEPSFLRLKITSDGCYGQIIWVA
jgi:predicted phosphodiesterase